MFLPWTANAAEYEVQIDGINYYLASNQFDINIGDFVNIAVVEFNFQNPHRPTGSVTIPESVNYEGDNYIVKHIGSLSFLACSGMTSISIPNTVTNIGDEAFVDCSNLESVYIGNSLTEIGHGVFGRCNNLNDVYCNANPQNIVWEDNESENCFKPNKGTLFHVTDKDDWEKAFPNANVTFVEGSSSLNTELDGIYYYLDSSTKTAEVRSKSPEYTGSVVIPESIKYEGVTYSVKSIETSAFNYCSGLTSIAIPNSITSIGGHTFRNCSSLTSVIIPNSVTSIGGWAFYGCSSLSSIKIPNSVTSIGYIAFAGCRDLTRITVDNGNSYYDSRGECNAIIEKSTNALIQGCKNTIIPNSVTSIGKSAFYGCSSLTSINIPNSVNSIGDNAFDGCSGLTSLFIPNSVTNIGGWAFCDCSNLTSIFIPKSVTTIEYYAFSSCKNLDNVYCYADPKSLVWGNYDNKYYFKPDKATLFHVKNKSDWEEAFPDANVTFVEDLPMEGDANDDNKVNSADVTEMANAIVGKPSSKFNKMASDINGDNKVDILDFTRLIEFLLNQK